MYFPAERADWNQFRARSPRFGFVPAPSDGKFSTWLPGGRYYVVAVPDSRRNSWQSLEFFEADDESRGPVKVEF